MKPKSLRSQGREIHQIEENTKANREGGTPLMGRRDRTLGETLPPKGQLQTEGTWSTRRDAPSEETYPGA